MTIEAIGSTVIALDDGITATSYSNLVLGGCISEDGTKLYTLHSCSITGTTRYGRVFSWSIDPSIGLTIQASSQVFNGVDGDIDFRHISLINSASAVVLSSTGAGTHLTGGWHTVELSSLYVTAGDSTSRLASGTPNGYPITAQYYGQQQLTKLSSGVALSTCASWSNNYPPFDIGDRSNLSHYGPLAFKANFTSGKTITAHLLDLHPYEYLTCVLNIGSTVLAGTSFGNLIEVDSSLRIIKKLQVIPTQIPFFDGQTYVYDSQTYNQTWYSSTLEHHISSVAYYNGIIAATTSEGILIFIDWVGNKVLSSRPYFQGGYRAERLAVLPDSSQHIKIGPSLSNVSSGVCLAALTTASRGSNGSGTCRYVFLLDLVSQNVDSYTTLPQNNNIPAVYTGISNSIGWSFHNFNGLTTLTVYRVSPKYRIDKYHAIVDSGQYKIGRKIIIVDDGVSNSKVDGDFVVTNTPRVYSVASGKRIIEISLYGSGVAGRKGEVSIYNT